jgi:hypothetical protein
MQDVTPKAVTTICDGGFRIEIGSDELTVARDGNAGTPRTGAIAFSVLVIGATFICFKLLPDSFPSFVNAPLTVLAVAAVLIGLVVRWTRHARIDNLHCTRKNLGVIRVVRGRETQKRVFARARVREINFTAVSWSTSGPTFALVFKVDGKEIEVLRGIESPEAQTVLRELQRLGYDVEFDVGMAMMVQMAIERRRSGEE